MQVIAQFFNDQPFERLKIGLHTLPIYDRCLGQKKMDDQGQGNGWNDDLCDFFERGQEYSEQGGFRGRIHIHHGQTEAHVRCHIRCHIRRHREQRFMWVLGVWLLGTVLGPMAVFLGRRRGRQVKRAIWARCCFGIGQRLKWVLLVGGRPHDGSCQRTVFLRHGVGGCRLPEVQDQARPAFWTARV